MTAPQQNEGESGGGGASDIELSIDLNTPPVYPVYAYHPGHVKRNPATNEVALRTGFSEDTPQMAALAWCVATPAQGARTAATADVASWEDLYVAPPPEGA